MRLDPRSRGRGAEGRRSTTEPPGRPSFLVLIKTDIYTDTAPIHYVDNSRGLSTCCSSASALTPGVRLHTHLLSSPPASGLAWMLGAHLNGRTSLGKPGSVCALHISAFRSPCREQRLPPRGRLRVLPAPRAEPSRMAPSGPPPRTQADGSELPVGSPLCAASDLAP